jgi:D-alanyl-D-alanine carboxypeptidase
MVAAAARRRLVSAIGPTQGRARLSRALPFGLGCACLVALTLWCAPASAAVALTGAAQRSLDSLTRQAGGDTGVVVADARTGAELYGHRPSARRILASNTKLFIAAAAAHRWGERVAPELARILVPSDNDRAEALAARLGSGSRKRGLARVHAFDRSLGVHAHLTDGSGLDARNRAAPRDVVRLLVAMRHGHGHRGFIRALPVAGRTGTLTWRMRGTAAEGRCHAKTGTLFLHVRATSLSGYCNPRWGRPVVVSILINGLMPDRARPLADRMLARIAAGVAPLRPGVKPSD